MKTFLCLLTGATALLGGGCAGAPQASAESVPVAMAPSGPPPPPPPEAQPVTQTVPVAQTVLSAPTVSAAAAITTTGSATQEPGSLEELVAPIALYPDPLLALILPASTASSDLVLAARYLNSGGDANAVDSQPWDDSVKGLAHYPDVIKWMDENLAWTQRLGEAYLHDPNEVMASIQRDRSRAQANGVLTTTPQQQVVVEDSYIRIVPAQPDVIYVPRYDPEIIYIEQPIYRPDPWLTFGIGFGVGAWLAYDCDWHSHTIWVDRHYRDHWREHDWRRDHYVGRQGVPHDPRWSRWTPPPNRMHDRDQRRWDRTGAHFVAPTPIAGAPRFDHRRDDRRWERRDRGQTHREGDRPDGGRVAEQTPRFRAGARVPQPVDAKPIPTNRAVVAPKAEQTRSAPNVGPRPDWRRDDRRRGPTADVPDRGNPPAGAVRTAPAVTTGQAPTADALRRPGYVRAPGRPPQPVTRDNRPQQIAPPPPQAGGPASTANSQPRTRTGGEGFRRGAPSVREYPGTAPAAAARPVAPTQPAPGGLRPAPVMRSAPAMRPAPVAREFAPGARVPAPAAAPRASAPAAAVSRPAPAAASPAQPAPAAQTRGDRQDGDGRRPHDR